MPSQPHELYARTDEQGRLIIPPELAAYYGIKPNSRLLIEKGPESFQVLRSVARLSRLYIEPTNLCNLDCRTCVRHSWQEPSGQMQTSVFAKIVEGLRHFSPAPSVVFGGFGEPLLHPRIIDMVGEVKALGSSSVELITNGTLLTEEVSQKLIEAGLDILWVSIDGARPESYTDIRLGAALPQVLRNVTYFSENRLVRGLSRIQIGIVFVAMKRNIADLPAVRDIAWKLGANRLMVTNVLPYTRELVDEVLYYNLLNETYFQNPQQDNLLTLPLQTRENEIFYGLSPQPRLSVSLPGIEINEITSGPLISAISAGNTVNWAGKSFGRANNRCPFIEKGAGAIRWDGHFSPCLPLSHSYRSYLDSWERFSRHWSLGNAAEKGLAELWNLPEHIAFRERVQSFDFSPCTLCGGCEKLDFNEEDCFGNGFPVCGGCLWAQGFIHCP